MGELQVHRDAPVGSRRGAMKAHINTTNGTHPGPVPRVEDAVIKHLLMNFIGAFISPKEAFNFGSYMCIKRTHQIRAAGLMSEHNKLLLLSVAEASTGLRIWTKQLEAVLTEVAGEVKDLNRSTWPHNQWASAVVHVMKVIFKHGRYLLKIPYLAVEQMKTDEDVKSLQEFIMTLDANMKGAGNKLRRMT
ncbi:hypothetical protein N9L68_04850 [bacterium]|nr:hypothetical protein [bacterium]